MSRYLKTVLAGLFLWSLAVVSSAATDEQQLTDAVAFYQQQKYAEAETIFADLHKREPEQMVYLNNLAAVQIAKGDVELALKTLQQAIDTDENYSITQKNINELYAYKASQAYAKALDKEDNSKPPQLVLITALKPLQQQAPVVVSEPVVTSPEVTEKTPEEILTTLTASWAQAWMQSDVEQYLQLYAANFNPDGKTSHEEWLNQRRYRLRNSKEVQVSYNQLAVFVNADKKSAIVEFVQLYRSGSYQDKVRKQLLWSYEADNWRIAKETVIETL
jgi:tetratricopeptide (TPR) repeat protein